MKTKVISNQNEPQFLIVGVNDNSIFARVHLSDYDTIDEAKYMANKISELLNEHTV